MTKEPRYRNAFSLAELLLALGLLTVSVLAVIALSISALKTDQKTVDTAVGNAMAKNLLLKTVDQVRADLPAGTKANFFGWAGGTPWSQGKITQNRTEYSYTISAQTVTDTAGVAVGNGLAGNRLKKLDVVVLWWPTSGQSQRAGYGQLRASATQLVSESE